MGKSNNNGHVWFHDFMVTEGNTDLCWKPSQKETRTQIAQLDNRISSTVTSVETIDGKVNKAQSQIDQHAHQIATKLMQMISHLSFNKMDIASCGLLIVVVVLMGLD